MTFGFSKKNAQRIGSFVNQNERQSTNDIPQRKRVVGGQSAQRTFFKTIDPPTGDYPPKSQTPNVYYCQRVNNVGFAEVVGHQELQSTPIEDEDKNEYIFNLTEEYIVKGKVILGFKSGTRWYTIDKVLTCKVPCFKCLDFDDTPFRWELTVEGITGDEDCENLNGTFALEQVSSGCRWETIGEESGHCANQPKWYLEWSGSLLIPDEQIWRIVGACGIFYEIPDASWNCYNPNTLAFREAEENENPPPCGGYPSSLTVTPLDLEP